MPFTGICSRWSKSITSPQQSCGIPAGWSSHGKRGRRFPSCTRGWTSPPLRQSWTRCEEPHHPHRRPERNGQSYLFLAQFPKQQCLWLSRCSLTPWRMRALDDSASLGQLTCEGTAWVYTVSGRVPYVRLGEWGDCGYISLSARCVGCLNDCPVTAPTPPHSFIHPFFPQGVFHD